MYRSIVLFLILCAAAPSVFAQNILTTHDPEKTLNADQCYDVVKTVWDGLKKISEDYQAVSSEKGEFESTAEYTERIRKSKDDYINKIRKFYSDNKLSSKTYSVWLKADLAKYDADNQTYGLKSPTQILVQPEKKEIEVLVPPNKYVTLTEKNTGGYRRAYIHLNTNPEFTWFVNKQTAQDAKGKEEYIFFKMFFTFDISFDEKDQQIVLQFVPTKIALMNQSDNFVYWSDEIR